MLKAPVRALPTAGELENLAPRSSKRRRRTPRQRQHGWLYMAPAVIFVLAMTAYPLYFAVRFSLFETQMWDAGPFVGMRNYTTLFGEKRFQTDVIASVVYVFGGVILSTACGLGLALALRHSRGVRTTILRTVVIIPWVTSEVVGAVTWRWMLNPQYGPLSHLFQVLGLPDFPNLFESGTAALVTLTLVNVWRSLAFPMLMCLGALQGVPQEIEEAAAVDGANSWQRIRYILVPAIMPVITVTVIVLTIHFLNMMVLVNDLTGGGPLGSTEILGLRLYREAFQYFNVDTAATLTMIMLIINFALAIWYFKALQRQAGGDA
jgi:multiple sugar transport system permease protein